MTMFATLIAKQNRLASIGNGLRSWAGLQLRKELLASAGWSLASAVVVRGANVLLMMICARVLREQRFGELTMILSTVGVFSPVAGLGLGMTTTKYLAELRTCDREKAGRILNLSLVAAGGAGILMAAVLIVLAPMLALRTLGAPQLATPLAMSSGLLLFGVVETVQTGALTGLEAFSGIARLSVWNGVLSLPLTAFLVYTNGLAGAVISLTVSSALACVLNAVVLRATSRKLGIETKLRACWSEWRILLSFSLPTYLAGMALGPATWATNALLVNQAGGYREMALYSAADRWRILLIFVPLAASRIAVPVFARLNSTGDRTEYRRVFRANLLLAAAASIIPVLFCIAFAGPLMGLYGESFSRGWLLLVILAPSAIPTVLNSVLGSVLLAHGWAWSRMGIDVILSASFLGIAMWSVPRWSATGLAGSFAVAYSIAALLLFLGVRKIHASL